MLVLQSTSYTQLHVYKIKMLGHANRAHAAVCANIANLLLTPTSYFLFIFICFCLLLQQMCTNSERKLQQQCHVVPLFAATVMRTDICQLNMSGMVVFFVCLFVFSTSSITTGQYCYWHRTLNLIDISAKMLLFFW